MTENQLPAPVAAVEIKLLEWREEPIPPAWQCLASSGVGLYCIPLGGKIFELRFRDQYTLGEFDTLEAAKAVAQADFEMRIRSALAHPAALSGGDSEPLGYVESNCSKRLATGRVATIYADKAQPTDIAVFARPFRADAVTDAATELVDFAWSAVVTDCTESAEYLNSLVDNLRAALAAAQSHYESRILAALAPPPVESVQGVTEAADIYEQAATLAIPHTGSTFYEGVNAFRKQLELKAAKLRAALATAPEGRPQVVAFPPTTCNAWEDCNHDGLCHDRHGCGGIGPNSRAAAPEGSVGGE